MSENVLSEEMRAFRVLAGIASDLSNKLTDLNDDLRHSIEELDEFVKNDSKESPYDLLKLINETSINKGEGAKIDYMISRYKLAYEAMLDALVKSSCLRQT